MLGNILRSKAPGPSSGKANNRRWWAGWVFLGLAFLSGASFTIAVLANQPDRVLPSLELAIFFGGIALSFWDAISKPNLGEAAHKWRNYARIGRWGSLVVFAVAVLLWYNDHSLAPKVLALSAGIIIIGHLCGEASRARHNLEGGAGVTIDATAAILARAQASGAGHPGMAVPGHPGSPGPMPHPVSGAVLNGMPPPGMPPAGMPGHPMTPPGMAPSAPPGMGGYGQPAYGHPGMGYGPPTSPAPGGGYPGPYPPGPYPPGSPGWNPETGGHR